MRVVVTTEAHFGRGPDGQIRSDTGGRAYEFWTRYLAAFEHVHVVARVSDTTETSGVPVEGIGVSVIPVRGYNGPVGTARNLGLLRTVVRAASELEDSAFVLRVPSHIGSTLARILRRRATPYAVEVVGDPYEVFSTRVTHPFLDRGLRRYFTGSLRRTVRGARAVAYVTSRTLQRRYPPAPESVVTYFSSVHLPDEAFIAQPPEASSHGRVVIAVGTHSQMYKGHDLLIEAAASLKSEGRSIIVRLVGSGRFHEDLKHLAMDRKVVESVQFVGNLPAGSAVREALDGADLFAMPSRTEGLPRALIEAMARGLPCIGTDVGAIPELLEPTELVESGNAAALAQAIDELLIDRERRQLLAEVNLRKAQGYHEGVLGERRRIFYSAVRDLSSNNC